jgi:hypothetical protein
MATISNGRGEERRGEERRERGARGLVELKCRTLRRTAAAARQARFMAWRYALSFAGAWKPAPTCSATKNLRLGLLEALARSSPAPPTTTAVPPAPPPPVAITSSTRREEVSKLAAGGPCRVGILHFVFRIERKGME